MASSHRWRRVPEGRSDLFHSNNRSYMFRWHCEKCGSSCWSGVKPKTRKHHLELQVLYDCQEQSVVNVHSS